jgi:hypothetical protein
METGRERQVVSRRLRYQQRARHPAIDVVTGGWPSLAVRAADRVAGQVAVSATR